MARAPDPRIEKAKVMYLEGVKLVEIASQLNLPEGTVRRWKCTHKWDSERSDKKSERSNRKKGGQPGNKNGKGGPPGNKKAEKHGFFSKYLPEETLSIIQEMPENPLDVLWDQIQIAYAAIIRAQQIMYVHDRNDVTTTKIAESEGNVCSEKWEIQQAWDKQANFLSAQARAQKIVGGKWLTVTRIYCIKIGIWQPRSRKQELNRLLQRPNCSKQKLSLMMIQKW